MVRAPDPSERGTVPPSPARRGLRPGWAPSAGHALAVGDPSPVRQGRGRPVGARREARRAAQPCLPGGFAGVRPRSRHSVRLRRAERSSRAVRLYRHPCRAGGVAWARNILVPCPQSLRPWYDLLVQSERRPDLPWKCLVPGCRPYLRCCHRRSIRLPGRGLRPLSQSGASGTRPCRSFTTGHFPWPALDLTVSREPHPIGSRSTGYKAVAHVVGRAAVASCECRWFAMISGLFSNSSSRRTSQSARFQSSK